MHNKTVFFFYLFCILSNTSISKICLKWYVSAKIYLEIWRIQNIFCEKYLFQPCCLQHQILWTTIFISFYFILAYSLFAILALKSLVLPPLTHSCFLSIFIFRFAHSTPSLLIPLLSLATKQRVPFLDLPHTLLNHICLSLCLTHTVPLIWSININSISWVRL